jgi:hypothetical protein
MRIGIDFDNTIACYDGVFHRAALERGIIPADLPLDKTSVRDHLRAAGREADWTELQGVVYGPRIGLAAPFSGVAAFFGCCAVRGIETLVISHRTRVPYLGEAHDLHRAAREWLGAQALLPASRIYFETSREEKLARIAGLRCSHFVDDLPELLTAADFPVTVEPILFDPEDRYGHLSLWRIRHWDELRGWLESLAA